MRPLALEVGLLAGLVGRLLAANAFPRPSGGVALLAGIRRLGRGETRVDGLFTDTVPRLAVGAPTGRRLGRRLGHRRDIGEKMSLVLRKRVTLARHDVNTP